jgi:acyl transferase domain-containing protein
MKKLLFPEGNEKADEEPYELMTFEERLVPAPVSDSDITEKEHRILCFAQGADLRQSATEEAGICSGKIDIVWVQAGEQYNRFSATDYAINYDHEEDFEKCLLSVMEEGKKVDEILYLIPMEDNLYFRNHAPLIYLLKSLFAAGLGETKLYIAGAADDELNLAYAKALIGMERSVGVSELSANIAVILTDSINTDKRAFLGTMIKECLLGTTESVIYENGERKCYRVKTFEIEKSNKSRIRKNGTYLITGGMGGLGLIFARHLGQKYGANLVLTGRKSESDIQDKLDALKNEGVNAVYVSADVCNEEQIKKAVETAKTRFGALNGVIHAAGLPEGKAITQKDEAEFLKITRPKMQGTLLLEKALENVDIDFMCYFSSISAVLGDFGSFDYAVGNRFLVSYAEHRRSAKGFSGETIVIEWPFWHDGGMGFATEAAERMYMKTSGQKGLTSQVGTVLFDLLIDSGKDCSFAMYGIPERVSRTLGIDLSELKKVNLNEVDTEPEKKAAAACEVSTASDVKEVTTVSSNTSKEILDKLHGLVCKILGVGINDIDDNLFLADFGFDSISLSQFAKDITTILNVKVTPDVFYRYTTLNELTGFISEHVKATEVKAAEPSDKTQQKDAYVAPLSQDGIVIVGISGKFPDADNVDELWDILVNGVEAIHGAPKRKGWENFKDTAGNVRLGALKTIDEFDPAFFEISPREACFMDPRQRLLLEETYGAMMDAGISQKEIDDGRIGMFIGAEEGDYGILSSGGSVTANHNGVLAARLSYFLNLHGPNMCINTACSSGLVAFHQACQSLRTGECDIAIAAGVNLMCTPVLYEGMKKAGMLSESGSCYTFDKRADGMVPSEAVAALVLKRRQAAIRDKDHIYAEVLGSEINYDGRTNGITAPSGKAQAQLLEDTYKRFGIDPSGLNYYVAHGTGTRIGDPIELNSAFEAFSKAGVKKNSCIITSTKPNIGHSLAASGLVSLISLILAMKNEVIPGEINLDEPSDYVDWEESPFVINRKNRPFKDGNNRRIGAVSAFGMSGTNAHVVVGSVKRDKPALIKKAKWLFVFSAKTEKVLKALIKASIEDFKKNKKEEDLPGICYTLLNGRVHYDHRLAFAAGSLADAISKLEKALWGDSDKSIFMDCVEKGFVPKEKTLQISKLLIKQVCDGSEPDKLQGALNMLAQMYSKGIAPDGLYDNLDVIKVTLSPYPFEKKSYWVPETEPEKTENPKPKAEPEVKPEPKTKPEPKEEPVKVEKPEVKPAVKEDKKDTPKTEVVKRNMNNTENLSIETVLKDLSESLAKELFMEEDEISYDRSFLEMGLDSIVGVEWMRHINKTYGLDIESTRIYEYPTLMELANYIISIKNKPEKETTEDKTPVEEQPKDEEQALGVLRSLSDAAAFEFNEENKSVGTISLKPLTDAAVNISEAVSQDAQEKPAPSASEVPEVDVEEIMKDLAESLAKELFMEPGEVDYDQGFMEMGLDSIVGVEWIRYINKKYNLNVESTRLYEYPTIIKLASYIVSLSSGDGGKAPVKEAPKKEEAKASSKDDIDSIMDKIYSGEIDENAMDLF